MMECLWRWRCLKVMGVFEGDVCVVEGQVCGMEIFPIPSTCFW